jgi:hypothetical protein
VSNLQLLMKVVRDRGVKTSEERFALSNSELDHCTVEENAHGRVGNPEIIGDYLVRKS